MLKQVVPDSLTLLGFPVRDRVTGMTGVITSVSFDLYGCVQCIVNPGMDSSGKMLDSLWFDINRLEPTDAEPKMQNHFIDTPLATARLASVAHAVGPADKPSAMPRG